MPAALGLAVLAGALSGCGGDAGSSGASGYVSGNGVITRLAESDRRTPGTVSGTSLEGEPIDLADHLGRVVVINVWGTWCPPCRAEADDLAEAARRLADEDVDFLGINTRDSGTDQGIAFQRRFEVPYPSIFDPGGRTLLAFDGTLRPDSIPSTVIIDREGRVAASILGEVSSTTTLVDLVRDVLGEAA